VRLGGVVAKDMIGVPIGPDMRMVVVGAPTYFARRPRPKKPQDLTDHTCINLRLPTHGGLYAWEFEKGGRELRVRVEGQLVFNSITPILNAALAGFGLTYLPETQVQPHLANGRLIEVLANWCPPFSATISITRTASTLPPSPFWSMPCGTADETAEHHLIHVTVGADDPPESCQRTSHQSSCRGCWCYLT
jgi:DNA-binding transcriptional LysR family regulator